LAFHFQKVEKMQGSLIALYYAIAMGVDAGAALLFGVLYDKIGMKSLVIATALSCLFPLFAFSSTIGGALVGVVLWGIGMGAQESIMRAAIAHFSSKDKRATAYGLFNMVYGIAWFLGSSLFGILYGWSLPGAIVFSLLSQIVAIPLFVLSSRVR
ncbi:MAG: MFS transporter, partial [Breznakiellaceae bacterium]